MDNTRRAIIMVDDNLSNLNQGKEILKPFYRVYPAPSAAKLFETLDNVIPDLILLDIEMPEMSGYDVIRKLKADSRFAEIPVIFLTSKNDDDSESEGFDLGAMDYVTKPFSAPRLLKRIANQLLIVDHQAALKDYAENLEKKVRNKTAEVLNLQNAVLETVANLVEFRDKLTGGHITRTMLYMTTLIEQIASMGHYKDEVSRWNVDLLIHSTQLHDVGKIAISDLILNKPDKLSAEEFEIMKTHVEAGVAAIKKIMGNTTEHEFLNYALLVTGTHHEKWDGTGYPAGLKGYEIPLEGRLMAVADVYDALISQRPYKKAFTHEAAVKIIIEGSGLHFDPVIIEVFEQVQRDFERVSNEIRDNQ